MNIDANKLTCSLNNLDNIGRDLVHALDDIRQSQDKMRTGLMSMLESFGDLRLTVENSAAESQAVWEEFLRVIDYCFTMPECPPCVLDVLRSALEHLGYTAFGLPGEIVTDMGSIDIIARQPEPTLQDKLVIRQTVRVGLRRTDGNIIRYPKVTVAG